MRSNVQSLLQSLVFISAMPILASAGKLICPDTLDDAHHRDVMSTSAPEVKARAAAQNDSRQWSEIVKPLTQKAIKQAKAQRVTAIEEGIDHGCSATQTYVGQLIPVPDKPSGCDHRVVTRPADDDHVWVQVVATCKYDWACCTPEDGKAAHAAGGQVGYTMEGPLAGNSAAPAKPGK